MKNNETILTRMAIFYCLLFVNSVFAQHIKETKALPKPATSTYKTKAYTQKQSPQQFLLDQQKNSQLQKSIADVVVPDDQIVQGSECVGLDCVDNESFSFDTQKYKANNTRIKFEDTSTGVGFPTTDWQIEANESVSGGTNSFSILDVDGSKTPFKIIAGAPTNSFFLSSVGNLGLGNNNPILDIHVTTGDTPAMRLEQNSNSGFTAQTWDVAGNEANFFVRDITSGSRLPFRIRPGAPTSSIDIQADGRIWVKNAIVPASDIRLKHNFEQINDALGVIKKLNPLKYDFRYDELKEMGLPKERQIGLIAQEVEKVLPELVSEISEAKDKTKYKGLNYTGLIPILIKAIQEQQSEIETLKAKISHYEELNARMERMEALLNKEEKERKAEKK